MTADDTPERAAIYLSLHRGENYLALDVQLRETLRDARAGGRVIAGIYGDVSGALNPTRRRQVARLAEQLRAEALPASLSFATREPADRELLGQQARVRGFSIAVGPKHVTIQTPWWSPATDDPQP